MKDVMLDTENRKLYEWVTTSRHGGAVRRSHTVLCIRPQNNAEHTHGAMVLAQILCREAGVDPSCILQYLLMHDIAEAYTGDMPANVKAENPELRCLLNEVELDWTRNNVPEKFNFATVLSDGEKKLAKMADSLDLLMYVKDELALGNRHHSMMLMFINIMQYVREQNEHLGSKFVKHALSRANLIFSNIHKSI